MLLTATNVQVHSYIPIDIAFSILSKLSLKSFKRFQSVCKSWSLLFDDPNFMNMYRKSFLAKDSSYYDDKSLLLHLLGEDFHHHLFSLSAETFENGVKLKLLKPPFVRNHFEILGSVSINGVLCLRVKSIYNEGKIVILWNPTTEEYKQVPSSLSESISIGRNDGFVDYIIGYDRVKDDYKVIQIRYVSAWRIYREIYSLNSNSWKKLDVDISIYNNVNRHKIYIDGVCHWWNKDETQSYVVSFDFSREFVVKTFTPSHVDDKLAGLSSCMVSRKLMILNGSIAFISNYLKISTFHISILGEVGVKESWIKLFVVGRLPCLKYFVGAGKNDKMLFTRKDKELVWFDLNTGMIDKVGVKALSSRCSLLFHRESILPIRGI